MGEIFMPLIFCVDVICHTYMPFSLSQESVTCDLPKKQKTLKEILYNVIGGHFVKTSLEVVLTNWSWKNISYMYKYQTCLVVVNVWL